MKTKYSVLGSTLLLCTTVLTVGCSSGGGSGSSDSGSGGVSAATTVVSGTIGTGSSGGTTSSSAFASQKVAIPIASTDTVAVLRVDKNGDGLLDENDLTYTIPVMTDGSFTFDNVAVDATKPTKAQLSVAKVGYAPVVKTVTLQKDTPFSIFADVSNTPVLTQVVKLPDSAADRANTFLKFGITADENGLSSFSKLMTLSELKADADLGEGTLTTASISTAAFDAKVKSVTVEMQAFDSTKASDIEHFPGAFSGHGKPTLGTTATGDEGEGALESAAFDLIKLTDQNGENIELNMVANKLSGSTAEASTCSGMYWVRRVTSDQAAVIEAWGDDDDTTTGFQVPIWSNDNATGTWAYVGEADWDSSNSQFSICVDKKWEGYLNCDSYINVGSAPKELCVYAVDQFGDVADGLSFKAQNGNSYSGGYLYNGKAVLDLAAGTPADWNVSYSGAMTGWSSVGVDSSTYTSLTSAGCDFDLNVTVDNPYSAQVYVYAIDDQNKSIPNAYVTLQSNTYGDYYNKSAYTNAKGYTIFKVKPNVSYTAGYRAGSSAVNVNGAPVAPETADSGKYASVNVQDTNVAPSVYFSMRSRVTNTTQSVPFYISARDRNGDSLTISSFTLQNTALVEGVDYNVTNRSSYGGNLYIQGVLDLNSTTLQGISPTSLTKGSYTFKVSVTDGKLSAQTSSVLNVVANSAPVIGSLYLVDGSFNYYYANSAISSGDYSLNYYVYDRDGDHVNKTMKIDDNDYTLGTSVHLDSGDYNVTITANDGTLSATKETHIYVGNHAPVITSAGATSYLIDINKGDTFKVFAYARDAENSPLTVRAIVDGNASDTIALTKAVNYGTKYVSEDITLAQKDVSPAKTYTIIANDGDKNSTAADVSVEVIAANQPPIFTKELTDKQVNVNEAQDFECVATDPEGTRVTYAWKVNGKERSETGTTFSRTFTTTGSNTVSCIATDGDGKSSTSTASVLVVNPNQSGTLTVHAKYQGLIVALHGADFKITKQKVTDANGDAAFNVTGDRTTFSITAWPDMEIGKKLTMDLIRPDIVQSARYQGCEGNTSTDCTNADWCALMSADSIPTWVWDATTDDTRPAASALDTSPQDGSISQDELYAAAKIKFDGNNDGKLTYQELLTGLSDGENNSRSTVEDVYANVPVREYYLTLDQFGGDNGKYQEGSYGYDVCEADIGFNSLLTIDYSSTLNATATNSTNKDVYVSGSGYYYGNDLALDDNNSIVMNLYTHHVGANGKFTYLVKEKDSDASEFHFYLLNDKTQAEMEANVTIDASNFAVADTNVNFVNGDKMEIYLNAQYQKIYLDNSVDVVDGDNNDQTYTRKYFTHNGIEYSINTDGYDGSTGNYYSTYNYYGNGTLQSAYDIAKYPALDVKFTVNPNDNTWTLTGNDMSKLTDVGQYFSANSSSTDENGTTVYNNLNISTYWTVAPSQSPQVALEDVVPSEAYADANESVNGDNAYTNLGVDAEEFKGQTESSFLDLIAGSSSTPNSGEALYENGFRGVNVNAYFGGASTESNKAYRHSSIFRLRLNPSSK